MGFTGEIITVGLAPAWDVTIRAKGLDWGQHKQVDSVEIKPAGKALNICRALVLQGQSSIAAGLWGRQDFEQMMEFLRPRQGPLKVMMTVVDGKTRQNITVIDTLNNREIHLRSNSKLASRDALKELKIDLGTIVNKNSVCVFSGSMPGENFFGDVVAIIKTCQQSGAKIVLDTSGAALREIVKAGFIWLIKPNVQELGSLLGEQVADKPASLVKASRELLEKVEIVLISRGEKGAVTVTKKEAWQGRCIGRRKVLSTVGCGDYLLAGFLKGLKDSPDAGSALEVAIKVATAKAWGWAETKNWLEVQRKIKVQLSFIR
ncbi:MAG: hypothetical protein JXB29_09470 [Sedimentisphaerales bacterium]|nr:hypothetical protein [Sedimentisphaerales bacterium]